MLLPFVSVLAFCNISSYGRKGTCSQFKKNKVKPQETGGRESLGVSGKPLSVCENPTTELASQGCWWRDFSSPGG